MKRRWGLIVFFILELIFVTQAGAVPGPASVTAAEPGLPPDWRAEHVHTPRSFSGMGPRSLVVGLDGREHLVYGGDRLYYTSNDGSGWAVPVVVDPKVGVGKAASLAVDPAGHAHISYYDTPDSGLRYATNQSGAWVITVLETGGVGPATAITLDSSGRPHILYQLAGVTLGYRYLQADGTWAANPAIASDVSGSYLSAAMGSDGVLQAVFYSQSSSAGYLYYYRLEGGTWIVPVSPRSASLNNLGQYSSLALDSQNRPHIVYRLSSSIKHWFYNGSAWVEDSVSSANGMSYVSIAAGSNDLVRIAYKSENSSGSLWYGYQPDPNNLKLWDWSPVDETGGPGANVSLALDAAGRPRLAYLRDSDLTLRYKSLTGTTWPTNPALIDTEGPELGRCTRLALAADGTAHLTYSNTTHKQIFYARRGGSAWDLSYPPAASSGSAACPHGLALLGSGEPAVAYTNQDGWLHLATLACTETCQWADQSVINLVTLPESVALAYDPTGPGRPVISFIRQGIPRFAAYTASGWTVTPLDIVTASGQTALAVDGLGRPHVAFIRTSHELCYVTGSATTGAVTWTDPECADIGAGLYVSLRLNGQYWPSIAYTGLHGGLRFISKAEDPGGLYTWGSPQIVLPEGTIESPSLGLDAQQRPLISYTSAGDARLFLARRSGEEWQSQVIDASRPVGKGSALAVSPVSGLPHISYFDELNRGVKYAYQLITVRLPLVQK